MLLPETCLSVCLFNRNFLNLNFLLNLNIFWPLNFIAYIYCEIALYLITSNQFYTSINFHSSFIFVLLQEISYDSPRGGVSVITEKGDITTSYLLIQRARSTDTGEYKCIPSNAHPKTVHVHILKGSYLTAHFSTLDLFF